MAAGVSPSSAQVVCRLLRARVRRRRNLAVAIRSQVRCECGRHGALRVSVTLCPIAFRPGIGSVCVSNQAGHLLRLVVREQAATIEAQAATIEALRVEQAAQCKSGF